MTWNRHDSVGDQLLNFGDNPCSRGHCWLADLWTLRFSSDLPPWHPPYNTESPRIGAGGLGVPRPHPTADGPRALLTAVFDEARRRLLVFGGWDGTTNQHDTWSLSFDQPTAVAVRPLRAVVVAGTVEIVWEIEGPPQEAVTVLRRDGDAPWQERGIVRPRGSRVAFRDTAVRAGRRYTYALALAGQDRAGEVIVETPPPSTLTFAGFGANPIRDPRAFLFTLPAPSDVDIRLWDTRGRLLRRVRVPALAAGSHDIPVPDAARLASGRYVIEIQAAGRRATRANIVLR